MGERETYEKLMNDIIAKRDAIILEAVGGTCPTEKIREGGNICKLQDGSEVFSLNGVDLLLFKTPTVRTTLENGRAVIQANQAYWRLDR